VQASAAYNPVKHKALTNYIQTIGLHTESLRPEVYNRLLAPLRLERVSVKMEMILNDFGSKVFVSVPVSRANEQELPEIENYFLSRGAKAVLFAPISNRCAKDTKVFEQLASDPSPGCCRGIITQDLIVDWQGDVLLCCNDFSKEMTIGDLSRQTLTQTFENARRTELSSMLEEGRWAEIPSCSRCKFDGRPHRTAVAPN
jgi:radical SAM protein with 4Fe4S-binding SPASM domain